MEATPDSRIRPWSAVAIISATLLLSACSERPAPQERAAAPAPERPAASFTPLKTYSLANAQYVGGEACRECHAKRVEEFSLTGHFRGARLPGTRDVMGEYEPGKSAYQTRDPNLRYEMSRDGTNFFQTRIEKTGGGEKRTRKRAAMIYGTGSLDEIYLFWEGNRIHEMPMAYAGPLKRWINAPGYVDGQADFSHGANLCVHCHNTHMKPVQGSPDEFHRDGIIAGISCEKCHGPGSEHIAYHRDMPDAAQGKYIADPGSFSRERQNDLCSECHSDLGQPRKPLFSYRPGEALEDFYVLSQRQKSQEDEHTANHIGYLKQSECFTLSDKLTCVTCHDPHAPEGPENSLSAQRSCLGCHQAGDCGEHTTLPAPVRGQCIDCHMPTRPDLHTAFHGPDKLHVPGRDRREHRIAVHPLAAKQVLARHYSSLADDASKKQAAAIGAELRAQFTARAEELAANKQFATAMSAYRQAAEFAAEPAPLVEALNLLAAQRERLLIAFNAGVRAAARDDFEGAIPHLRTALEINPAFDQTHHQMGIAYQNLGNHEEAIANFQEALRINPDLPETYTHMGLSYHVTNHIDAAITNYHRALELKPRSSETHNNLGLAHRAKGETQLAREHYGEAIALDSKNASACNNLGSLFQREGDLDQAIAFYRKAAEAAPQFTQGHYNLAGALRQKRDYPGAIESYREAVKVGNHTGALNNLAMLLTMTGKRAEAAPHFESLLENQPNSVLHLVFLSRILATLEEPGKRDAKRAAELAARAVEITQNADPNALATLALAQAAQGDFTTAEATAQRAIAAAEGSDERELAASLRAQLGHYQNKKMPPTESLFPAAPQ